MAIVGHNEHRQPNGDGGSVFEIQLFGEVIEYRLPKDNDSNDHNDNRSDTQGSPLAIIGFPYGEFFKNRPNRKETGHKDR